MAERCVCGPIEFVVRTAEEWRDMSDADFEANLESFTKSLRTYHANNATHRSRPRLYRCGLLFS